jgi:hypothetical protein
LKVGVGAGGGGERKEKICVEEGNGKIDIRSVIGGGGEEAAGGRERGKGGGRINFGRLKV